MASCIGIAFGKILRAAFVETLFRMADNTNATKMSDILNEKFRSFRKMYGGRKDLDPETRRAFTRLIAQAVSLGFGNVVERVRKKPEQDGPSEWTTMDPKEQEKARLDIDKQGDL